MDKRIRLNILYDYYKDFLTDKQQEYFESYYYNNYSLGEIAEDNNISRNAVHNQLKIVEEKLEEFEHNLELVAKKDKILELLKNEISKDLLEQIIEIL
ncbi:MAG: hypothetical protein IJO43_03415 [Bacilli bacterium]|nr:hypothetical protein [Bacilli bacterium]